MFTVFSHVCEIPLFTRGNTVTKEFVTRWLWWHELCKTSVIELSQWKKKETILCFLRWIFATWFLYLGSYFIKKMRTFKKVLESLFREKMHLSFNLSEYLQTSLRRSIPMLFWLTKPSFPLLTVSLLPYHQIQTSAMYSLHEFRNRNKRIEINILLI